MPAVQVIDTTQDKPEPTGVEQFFSKLGKDYREKKDRNEIGNLISQYQQNREDANAWEDLQLGLEKSDISPSKRLETQKSLNETKQTIIAQDTMLNKKATDLEKENKSKLKETEKIKKETEEKQKELEKTTKTENEVREILLKSGEQEDEAIRLSKILSPASANARAKVNKEKGEEESSKKVTQEAFNNLSKLVPKAGRGTEALGMFGGENAKTAGEFTSLTGALESLLVEKVNRGTLSNTRFKYITETLLPKVTDTKATIKGKLKGLATILELDPTELENLDKPKEKKAENKAPEGKVRVVVKGSNPPIEGSVTPYPGMEAKYDIIK